MYVYRFLNDNNEIIYIGKATDLKSRLSSHTHLPKECYEEKIKIQYVELSNKDESSIYERYLINKISPKYNIQYNNNSSFMFEIPEQEWIDYIVEDFKVSPKIVINKQHKEYKDMDLKEKIAYHESIGDITVKTDKKVLFYKKEFLEKRRNDYVEIYNNCYMYEQIEDVFDKLCLFDNKAIIVKGDKQYALKKLYYRYNFLYTKTTSIYYGYSKANPVINYDECKNRLFIYFRENEYIEMYFKTLNVSQIKTIINSEFHYTDSKVDINIDYSDFVFGIGYIETIEAWKRNFK